MQTEPGATRADPDGSQKGATDGADERRPLRRQVLFGILLLCIPIAVSVVVRGRLPEFSLYPHELFLLPLLASIRLIWALRTRRRLWPLIDLPLIGLLFVFTGADDSPLDPALFLVYVLVGLYVERVPPPTLPLDVLGRVPRRCHRHVRAGRGACAPRPASEARDPRA
jgi:hypothetical protein